MFNSLIVEVDPYDPNLQEFNRSVRDILAEQE